MMVVGVRFRPCDRIYFFETNGMSVGRGIRVVAESEMGLRLGTVIKEKCIIEEPERQIKKILRVATEEDIEADKNNRSLEEEARIFCIERAKAHNLPMKVVAVESTLDRKRLIFYFTAQGRIDFRNLVRDIAGKYKTRIEMRQIGVRDEVKFISGIGACGRQACCSLFLTSFEPVSIGMAKKQELVLNPEKLSGICGRLKCCLRYEYNDVTTVRKQDILSNGVKPKEYSCHGSLHDLPNSGQATRQDGKIEVRENKIPSKIRSEPEIRSERKGKEKGEPFSRRKSFWKKKRR